MANRLIKETGSQDLSAAAFSLTAEAQGQMLLGLITLSASEGVTETVTLTIDQFEGSNYDVLLDSSVLNDEEDYIYKSGGSTIILNNGDKLTLACTNANTTGVVYGKILLIET